MVKNKKLQKKSFFDIESSVTASKISLYAASAEELVGRIVTLDLTRNLRGKAFELKIKLEMKEGKLIGEPVSLGLVGSYIRRMMRKGSDYVEDSFSTASKDGIMVIKPFLITRHKVSREVRKSLRNATKEHLISHAATRTSRELFNETMSNKIQKDLSIKLKKIYPLALCEIRTLELVPPKKNVSQ